MKRTLLVTVSVASMSLLAACGGGGGSSLPDECKTNSPLQITSPGYEAVEGEFTPTDTVIYQGKIVPGAKIDFSSEKMKEIEAESIGTAFRVIVADFPIKENQILESFNSGVFEPEDGGTYLDISLFPNESGEWQVGDVIDVQNPAPYVDDLEWSLGESLSVYLGTTLTERLLFGGSESAFVGSATVLAVDEKNLCFSIDYTAPIYTSEELFNVKGVISGKIEDYISGDIAG